MTCHQFFKTILWTLFVIITVFFGLIFYMSNLNVVELEYATYEKAIAADAFSTAALPEFLPRSSRNIRSRRDLDANVSVVTFDFGTDFEQFLSQQRSADIFASAELAKGHSADFSNIDELKYFPLLSSEDGLYNGSLLINLSKGKALYIEPPQGNINR